MMRKKVQSGRDKKAQDMREKKVLGRGKEGAEGEPVRKVSLRLVLPLPE